MQLNELGQIVADEWRKTAIIRDEIELDKWVVMPNHYHGILVIANSSLSIPRDDKGAWQLPCLPGDRLSLLGSAAVFPCAGIDFDLVADFTEQWDLQFEAADDFGGLHNLAGGVAFDGGLGIGDFAHHRVGQFH